MFVPLSLLIQDEQVLKTPEDVIGALDRWILPRYPNLTTQNVAMIKAECFGVLYSFQSAGRLHYRLKPVEVELAVNAFLEDRFWLETNSVKNVEVLHDHNPQNWMSQPNLFKCLKAIPRVIFQSFKLMADLIVMGVISSVYKFYSVRAFEVPVCPTKTSVEQVTKEDA